MTTWCSRSAWGSDRGAAPRDPELDEPGEAGVPAEGDLTWGRQGWTGRRRLTPGRQEGRRDQRDRGPKLILALSGGDEQGRNRGLAPRHVIGPGPTSE